MSDSSHPMLAVLGLDQPSKDDPFETPDAAAPDSTSPAAPDPEVISLDEALAELDGQGAPPVEPTSEPDAATSPTLQLTPEQIAALVAENETFKAERAQSEAAQQDEQFLTPWRRQQAINDDFFETEAVRIQRIGEEQGRSQDEIDAKIYQRVELGQGFGIQRPNPQTGQMEMIGRIQTERELQVNLTYEWLDHERGKNRPSVLEQLASTYHLDEADRTALAKFVTLPPDQLEELAKTLGAKNQRVSTTLTDITTQANRNVAANLSNGLSPGVPGASAPAKKIAWDHTRKSTELLAAKIGLMRNTG